jgi:hypothetical protein
MGQVWGDRRPGNRGARRLRAPIRSKAASRLVGVVSGSASGDEFRSKLALLVCGAWCCRQPGSGGAWSSLASATCGERFAAAESIDDHAGRGPTIREMARVVVGVAGQAAGESRLRLTPGRALLFGVHHEHGRVAAADRPLRRGTCRPSTGAQPGRPKPVGASNPAPAREGTVIPSAGTFPIPIGQRRITPGVNVLSRRIAEAADSNLARSAGSRSLAA